ncbi:hypothetical protein BT69DRAFT_1318205 [Atractiella rhizophila]|nr:hypothetical protein BT69DRAFT_1318205 [Atractiella rhizophila]
MSTSSVKDEATEKPFNAKKTVAIVLFSFGFSMVVTGLTGKRLMTRVMGNTAKGDTVAQTGFVGTSSAFSEGFKGGRAPKKVLKSWYKQFQAIQSGSEPKIGGLRTDLGRAFFDNRRLKEEALLEFRKHHLPNDAKGKQKEEDTSLSSDFLSDLGLSEPTKRTSAEEEDDFNGATYALRAFAIATAIVAVVAGTGYTYLLHKLDVWDMESLSLYLSEEFSPGFSVKVRALTNQLIPSRLRTSSPSELAAQVADEEAFHRFLEKEGESGFSQWIKDLDEAGEEHRNERAERWKVLKVERDRRFNINKKEDKRCIPHEFDASRPEHVVYVQFGEKGDGLLTF